MGIKNFMGQRAQKETAAKQANQLDELSNEINALKVAVQHNKQTDLEKNKEEIKELLSEEIVARYHLMKGEIANSLDKDPDLRKAIEVLNDTVEYNRILSARN